MKRFPGKSALAAAVIGCLSQTLHAEFVIHISVDGGGGPYVQSIINLLPNYKRLQTQGAWTNNARTDYDYTITLPNHTSQLTGRPVTGANGHNWTSNSDPPANATLASNNGGNYIASALDVAHDNGLRTAMFVNKSKFSIYDTSYNATNGANDVTGVNNGKDKIDTYALTTGAAGAVNAFIANQGNPAQYNFLHFSNPDDAGHSSGWGSATYLSALQAVDSALGTLFNFLDNNATFKNHTYIVLTADHGGGASASTEHSLNSNALNYTVPFYVWGPGVRAGVDLYTLNPGVRTDPGTSRPTYAAAGQPIRNGDAANLELKLLGLGPVPGSTINFNQALAVPEPGTLLLLSAASLGLMARRSRRS
jgi:hypothetical protein